MSQISQARSENRIRHCSLYHL